MQVRGPVRFEPATLIEGEVSIHNPSGDTKSLPTGTYADTTVEL